MSSAGRTWWGKAYKPLPEVGDESSSNAHDSAEGEGYSDSTSEAESSTWNPASQVTLDDDDDEEENEPEAASPKQQLKDILNTIRELEQEKKDKAAELRRVHKKWRTREAELKGTVRSVGKELFRAEEAIFRLERAKLHGDWQPEGPRFFSFLDGPTFNGFVAVLILLNIIVISVSMAEGSDHSLEVLDMLFVIFYLFELILRWRYYRAKFLIGPPFVVMWHWLDLILVIDGVVFSLVRLEGWQDAVPYTLQYVRVLRYLRIAKMLRTLVESNLAWTEADWFQTFILGVICINAFVMGAEVEYPEPHAVWLVLEHMFLIIFTFELTARIKYGGCSMFWGCSADNLLNLLDLVVVSGGILDQWALPLFRSISPATDIDRREDESARKMTTVLRLLRILRFLRILRLLRLIKSIPPLYTLIIGILKAMKGMGWVMLLTVTVLYISALLGVKLVGPEGLLIKGIDEDDSAALRLLKGHAAGGAGGPGGQQSDVTDEEMRQQVVTTCFPNMFDALFNMFKVMQMDLESMEPLFAWAPISKYIIMFYVVLMNWAIFSILTAVVSDEMAKVTGRIEEEEAASSRSKRNERLVNKIFDRVGAGDDGLISREQFEMLMEDEDYKHELCTAADIQPEDLKEFFDIMCKPEKDDEEDIPDPTPPSNRQFVNRDAFLKGLEKEQDSVNQRTMMKLENRLDSMDRTIQRQIMKLEDVIENTLGMYILQDGSPTPMSNGTSLHWRSLKNRFGPGNSDVDMFVEDVRMGLRSSNNSSLLGLHPGSSAAGKAASLSSQLGGLSDSFRGRTAPLPVRSVSFARAATSS